MFYENLISNKNDELIYGLGYILLRKWAFSLGSLSDLKAGGANMKANASYCLYKSNEKMKVYAKVSEFLTYLRITQVLSLTHNRG